MKDGASQDRFYININDGWRFVPISYSVSSKINMGAIGNKFLPVNVEGVINHYKHCAIFSSIQQHKCLSRHTVSHSAYPTSVYVSANQRHRRMSWKYFPGMLSAHAPMWYNNSHVNHVSSVDIYPPTICVCWHLKRRLIWPARITWSFLSL